MSTASSSAAPPADLAALARGGRINFLGFCVRLAARLPFLFIAGRIYGAAALGRFAYAILIVEFAAQNQAEGAAPVDAAVNAARLRFRPIVMTSLAFVLGVVPLAVARGAGAAARQSMGTGVLGGMLAATFVATLFVPLFFVLVSRRHAKRARTPPAAEHAAP